jgi:hypothetical protein
MDRISKIPLDTGYFQGWGQRIRTSTNCSRVRILSVYCVQRMIHRPNGTKNTAKTGYIAHGVHCIQSVRIELHHICTRKRKGDLTLRTNASSLRGLFLKIGLMTTVSTPLVEWTECLTSNQTHSCPLRPQEQNKSIMPRHRGKICLFCPPYTLILSRLHQGCTNLERRSGT